MVNAICHIEFVSNGMKETVKFYSDIFGWKITEFTPEYHMFAPGEGELGGGFRYVDPEGDEREAPRTVVYVSVDDIEKTLARIEAAGGKTIIPKRKISDEHGFFAFFMDPQGTIVGLWSAPGADG